MSLMRFIEKPGLTCLLLLFMLACEQDAFEKEDPDNLKAQIMLVNHTGHNSPNRYCGNELEVVFHINSPRERLEIPMDPDFRRRIPLDVSVGEFWYVSVLDARTNQILAETSGHFTGNRVIGGITQVPAIFLCPEDQVVFTFW